MNHPRTNFLEILRERLQVQGGKIYRHMQMFAFSKIIMFQAFLGIRVKFVRWDENSLAGVKIHQVDTNETVKCVESNTSYNSTFLN